LGDGAETYRIVRPLAKGGMATLHVAQPASGGSTVVIKRIVAPYDRDPTFRTLFADEGKIHSQLHHPHVVECLEVGEDADGPFLVFEMVEGTDLGVVMESAEKAEQPLQLHELLAVAIPLFDALAYAHGLCDEDGASLGVVHRDISPANVLLGEDGSVKLTDFGVAKSSLKTDQTVVGELKGKFAYMAPEQTRGELLDGRADLFSAGIVLYEALTAERLFDGPTDADVVHAVRNRTIPSLREKVPGLPSEIAQLVEGLLNRDRDLRPEGAQQVADALREVAESNFLHEGHRGLIRRLVRNNPRPEMSLPDGMGGKTPATARRRTQRVLQAAGAVKMAQMGQRPRFFRRPAVLMAGLGVGVVAALAFVALPTSEIPSPSVAPTKKGPQTGADATAPKSESQLAITPAGTEDLIEAMQPRPGAGNSATGADGSGNKRSGFVAAAKKKVLGPGKKARAGVKKAGAEKAGKKARGFGLLFLQTEPWAEVSIDGARVEGHTPLMGLRIRAGPHRVVLKNPVHKLEKTVTIEVPTDGEVRRFIDLTR
jgi:serine/threonine-protein kinase